jgi:uncharacterized membrane-anchored protein
VPSRSRRLWFSWVCSRRFRLHAFWLLAALAATPGLCVAQQTLLQSLPAPFKRGPLAISLAGQATLAMPAGFAFLPAAETRAVLREWGNRPSELTLGMVIPTNNEGSPPWFIVLAYFPEGYIRDDDAKEWNSSVLLDEIRKGLQASNEARRMEGAAQTEVVGWVARPGYDPLAHRLSWSVAIRETGGAAAAPAGQQGTAQAAETQAEGGQSVNVNTVILGRGGYVSASLVVSLEAYPKYVEEIKPVVAGVTFDMGARYTDFVAGTDRVSPRGLSALVAANSPAKKGWLTYLAASKVEILYVLVAALVGIIIGMSNRHRRRLGVTRGR